MLPLSLAPPPGPTPHLRRQAHRACYFDWIPRSYLSRCRSARVPFDWTLNPYRGCLYGCRYCYARYTHQYLELDPGPQFETTIFAKQVLTPILRAELRKLKPGQWLAIGTATDPYQPIEAELQVTRAILAELSHLSGLRISLATKSPLIRRDLELLQAIAARNALVVSFTITTTDPGLARRLEPKAPSPELRLKALAELAQAGVPTGVLCHPVMPFINDEESAVEAVARAAAEAGATYFSAAVLFLMPAARETFFALLRDCFPHLVRRYERLFAKSPYVPRSYAARIQELGHRLRQRYGLQGYGGAPRGSAWGEQLELPLELCD